MEDLNRLARDFHPILDAILWKLSSEYEGMKYSLGNAYEMTINVINNPLPFSKHSFLIEVLTVLLLFL